MWSLCVGSCGPCISCPLGASLVSAFLPPRLQGPCPSDTLRGSGSRADTCQVCMAPESSPPDPLGRLVGVVGFLGLCAWAVGRESGGAAAHSWERGGTPRVHFRALTQAVACGEISAGQGWPCPRALPAAPSPVGLRPPAGGTQISAQLRAGLCARSRRRGGGQGLGRRSLQPHVTAAALCAGCQGLCRA